MAARLDWIWDEDKKSMLKSCSSSGIRYLRSAPLSAQIISSFSPKISQICPKITFQCMSMLCKYYAFWEESREGFRRAAISPPPNLEHTSAMCDHHTDTGDSSKTSERSVGNKTVRNKTKRDRSDQNGKPEEQSRSWFRIGNSGAAALSESGTLKK